MSSVQALREFIDQRLAAAAGEIFTVFEETMVPYEEEIIRQGKLLQVSQKPQVKFHRKESPQHQKTSSSLEQEEHEAPHIKEEEEHEAPHIKEEEEHEAPHIKEEEDVVEVTVTDGESDDSLDSVRDLTTQRLTAAAGEIFTVFEQTIVQYEEEIDRQRRLLEIMWKPQIKLHRTELPQHLDCMEEQLFNQETNYCPEQEEPEPPLIKEEPEDPGLLQIKEEPEEPGILQFKQEQEEPEPSQIEEQQERSTSPEGEQLVLKLESDSFRVPFIEEQCYQSEPEDEPDTEQFLSHDSEVHDVKMHLDSESTTIPELKRQAEGEKLLYEEVRGETVRKKHKLCQNVGTVTDKKKRVCEICGKGFKRQSKLLDHMRTHTDKKQYSCETCGKSFSRPSNLFVHIRTHTGEKPYSCEICGKSFSVTSTLFRHMRTHTGEKPHSCKTCGKSFSQHSNLLLHMRTHTGEKPYSCERCGRSFCRQDNFLRHMKAHKEMKS